jgi:hypothetical protein
MTRSARRCPSRQAGETDGRRMRCFDHTTTAGGNRRDLVDQGCCRAVLWPRPARLVLLERFVHRLSSLSLDLGANVSAHSYTLPNRLQVTARRALRTRVCAQSEFSLHGTSDARSLANVEGQWTTLSTCYASDKLTCLYSSGPPCIKQQDTATAAPARHVHQI